MPQRSPSASRTSLTLLTVNDPLLAETAELRAGPEWLSDDSEHELRRFFQQTFEHRTLFPDRRRGAGHDRPAGAGDPARRARAPLRADRHEHARTHRRAKAVLRRDHRAGPARNQHSGAGHAGGEPGPLFLEDVRQLVGRVLAPVDLTAASKNQVQIAGALASAVDVPLLLAHVVEPLRFPARRACVGPAVESERRARSEKALQELIAAVRPE